MILLDSLTVLGATTWLLAGLVMLGLGAEMLVRGATRLALLLKLTPTVVGLTIVALGTSLPELVVSVAAQITALKDPEVQAVAWGNVVGSNIFNIGLVLGVGSLIRPLAISGSTVRLEYPFMLGSTFLVAILVRGSGVHTIDRVEGAFMLALFTIFTIYVIRIARKEVKGRETIAIEETVSEIVGDDLSENSGLFATTLVVLGSGALALGGNWLVDGAIGLAESLGVSNRFVSTVIVAAATGFPELVTTCLAVFQGRTDLAVGNVVGSNIFNSLAVLGTASLILPLNISPSGLLLDLTFMLSISALLGPLLLGKRLNRYAALSLLVVYLSYFSVLVLRATS